MKNQLLKYHFLCLVILCCGFVIAQDETINETQKYQYKDSPYQWHEIDTGMYNFEHYNFNQTDEWEYFDIGNSGLAQYSMTFEPNRKQGFQAGFSGFERYQYTIDKIKYYQIAKPFSEISYTMGTKRENIFQGRLAQNIKNRLEFGVDFMRLSSLGIFEGQRTRNSGFSLYSMIHSKNNRYHFGVDIAYNRVKATENGGIVEDFVDNDSIQYGNPLFYTSQLGEDAVTEQNNIDVLFSNHYDVGFSQIDSINDTVAVKRYYATWRFSQELGIERERYHFLDESPDSAFYGDFFQIADSAVYDMEFRTITNGIGVSYLGAKEKSDTVEYRHFAANGFIRSQHVKVKERSFYEVDFKTQNVFVEGNFYANPLRESSLFYQAKAIYYLAGYNQHDLHLSGDIGWEMNKWGNVSASASFHNVSPTWIESFYFRKGALWSNEYKKTKSLQFAVQYQLPKYKASIGFSYSLVDKHIYFDENAKPIQTNESINYWKLSLRKDFQWKGLHLDNFVGVQGVSQSEIVRIPTLFFKTSFYLQGKIFKGNMLATIGADLRYNTRFDIPAWQPLTGQFYLQNEKQMGSTPVLDIFLSMQVKSIRIFAKANYVNEGLKKRNYYTALGYPSRGRTFAGGLTWRFFE